MSQCMHREVDLWYNFASRDFINDFDNNFLPFSSSMIIAREQKHNACLCVRLTPREGTHSLVNICGLFRSHHVDCLSVYAFRRTFGKERRKQPTTIEEKKGVGNENCPLLLLRTKCYYREPFSSEENLMASDSMTSEEKVCSTSGYDFF